MREISITDVVGLKVRYTPHEVSNMRRFILTLSYRQHATDDKPKDRSPLVEEEIWLWLDRDAEKNNFDLIDKGENNVE